MGKMKLLMLGAGLISIANFATASSEEGIVPEEVVVEELPPPPFYRYSGDEIDWVGFPSYCRRKGRGDYYCKECDITHASGYKCPIDLFCDPSKDPNELANPLFFSRQNSLTLLAEQKAFYHWLEKINQAILSLKRNCQKKKERRFTNV